MILLAISSFASGEHVFFVTGTNGHQVLLPTPTYFTPFDLLSRYDEFTTYIPTISTLSTPFTTVGPPSTTSKSSPPPSAASKPIKLSVPRWLHQMKPLPPLSTVKPTQKYRTVKPYIKELQRQSTDDDYHILLEDESEKQSDSNWHGSKKKKMKHNDEKEMEDESEHEEEKFDHGKKKKKRKYDKHHKQGEKHKKRHGGHDKKKKGKEYKEKMKHKKWDEKKHGKKGHFKEKKEKGKVVSIKVTNYRYLIKLMFLRKFARFARLDL